MRPVLFLSVMLLFASACSGASGVAPSGTTTALPRGAAAGLPTSEDGTVDDISIAANPVAVPRPVVTTSPPTTTNTTTIGTTTTTGAEPSTTPVPTTTPPAAKPPVPTVFSPPTSVPTPAAPPVQTGAAIIGIDPPPGTLALTFDDGPFVGWTEEILSLLDDHDVTATFFISTYLLPGNEYLISQIVAAGHSVQTHGDQHIDPTTRTADEVRIDLQTSIDKIVAAGAPRPVCFRPPFGMTGLVVESVAAELGLTVLTWNLNSLDYSFQEPTGVINRVLDQAGAGSVVLMHDQWAPIHRTTLAAIIPELRARGLEFSPLCTTSG